MGPVEKIEEGGRKALAYNQATQVVVHGFGDKDFHLIADWSYFGCKWPLCFGHARYCVYGDTGPGGEKVPPG
jgi:hypothetical protein